ncbi:hypothetical protein Tsubulata_003178 [Turnera subulata]|uniref:TF-B3 domain-containing protein n=1 Tax=Turnera subulata TaxID=218843 RepID=A0A9Q0FYH9_9ROSI|nr:hypothetical protein Tsubulata_003178 [Turnera subulata]
MMQNTEAMVGYPEELKEKETSFAMKQNTEVMETSITMKQKTEVNMVGYPEELKENAALALFLVSLRYEVLDPKAYFRLEELKRKTLGNSDDIDTPKAKKRAGPSQKSRVVVKQEGAINVEKDFPGCLGFTQDEIFEMVNNYKPPRIPPVPGLEGLIGRCSEPFEKQLTGSDVRKDQCRLAMSTADVQKNLMPLLKEDEKIDEGIDVVTYDKYGKEFDMVFKVWSEGRMNVLIRGWKTFCNEHNLQEHRDFVTVWMFRRLDNDKLSFVITRRTLPICEEIKRRRMPRKNPSI